MDFMSLPNEVLWHIFSDSQLTISDLGNLMLSCTRFRNVIRESNEIWKKKFLSRWPRLYHLQEEHHHPQWMTVARWRIDTASKVLKGLGSMSAACYPEGEPSVAEMYAILNESPPDFIEDELQELIFHSNKNEYLTLKFYGAKLLRYLRSRKIEALWRKFLLRPPSEQSLLEGAVLISQWGQMDQEELPSLQKTTQIIDDIVERVGQLLSISPQKSPRKILSAINTVLYDEYGLQGNSQDYHSFDNSYIDKVLETRKGIPITLCIIYLEVANRLGVKCEPVSFPHHFLLRWKEFPERAEEDSYTYIDAFNRGAGHLPRSCPALIGQPRHNIHREAYAAVDPMHVFQRMVNNLIQCSRVHWDHGRGDQNGLRNQMHFSRLACCVTPGQTPSVVAYAELCVFLGAQLEEAIQLLQSGDFQDDQYDQQGVPGHLSRVRQITYEKCANKLSYQLALSSKKLECRRPGSIKYSVGMVMRHLRYNYTCVIAFWDSRCKASDEWIERMGVLSLVRGMDQPFYHVLVSDGSSRYAAEDNLEIAPAPTPTVNHPDVGLHFQRFDGQRYVGNAEKRAHFPEDDDAAVRSLLDQ